MQLKSTLSPNLVERLAKTKSVPLPFHKDKFHYTHNRPHLNRTSLPPSGCNKTVVARRYDQVEVSTTKGKIISFTA
jgi:hypothetical protein